MDLKNMGALVAGLVVSVLLLAAVLVPIVGTATQTEATFTNEGAFYITEESDETHTLVLGENLAITVDGESVTVPTNNQYTVLGTDTIMIRTIADGSGYQLRGSLYAAITTATLTIGDGTITGSYVNNSNTTVELNQEYTEYILATEEETNAVMLDYTNTPYLNGDSKITARGLTNLKTTGGNSYQYIKFEGSINDGITIEAIDGYTYSDISINYEAVDGYLNLYKVTSITFTATYTDESATDCTYTAYVVPAEVTAELATHPSDEVVSLLQITPLLVTVGIIVGIIGMMYSRRE